MNNSENNNGFNGINIQEVPNNTEPVNNVSSATQIPNQVNNNFPNINITEVDNVNSMSPQVNNGPVITPVSDNQTNVNPVNNGTNITPVESATQNSNVLPTTPISNDNSEEKPEPKGQGFKRFLLVIFLIFAGVFIYFLPDVSECFSGRNRKTPETSTAEVANGTLKCTRTNESDSSETEYDYSLSFKDKGVVTGVYTTTLEDENEKNIDKDQEKCKKISEISEEIEGIDVSCSSADNISTTTQNNVYREIKSGKLTAFTEAGGIYPEYKYKDNVYSIKDKLVKAGYDCSVTSSDLDN